MPPPPGPSGSPPPCGGSGSPPPGFVDARHQQDLDALRGLLRTAVELESPVDFGEVPGAGDTNRRAYLAHFPESARGLQEWDAAVERARIAPGALWEWLAAAAAERGIAEPAFAVGSLLDTLAILTLRRARTWQLGVAHELSFEQFRDRRRGEEYVSMHLNGQRVVQFPIQPYTDVERRTRAAGRLMQGLFDDAQASEAAHAVVAARDSLLVLKEQLLELLAPRAPGTPTPIAAGCPSCAQRSFEPRAAGGDAPDVLHPRMQP